MNYVDPKGHWPTPWQKDGADFESIFQSVTGAIKNGKTYLSENFGGRRPDFFLGQDWVVETKNVAKQYLSSQIQGLQEIADGMDRRMLVVVNDTTKATKNLIDQVRVQGGEIIRMAKDGTFMTLAGETIKDLGAFLGSSVDGAMPLLVPEELMKEYMDEYNQLY